MRTQVENTANNETDERISEQDTINNTNTPNNQSTQRSKQTAQKKSKKMKTNVTYRKLSGEKNKKQHENKTTENI